MLRGITTTLVAILVSATASYADPIEGNWRTARGETARIASCGGNFCITLKTGKFSGKHIGSMSADGGGSYSGSITDPENDKTYSGSGSLSGSTLKMEGCVLGVLCKSQTWRRM